MEPLYGLATNNPATSLIKRKEFIKATDNNPNKIVENKPKTAFYSNFSGNDAKKFYLDITSTSDKEISNSADEPDADVCEIVYEVIQQPYKNCKDAQVINKAMKYAEEDNVSRLQEMIDIGLTVNLIDSFGWSLLMVAAFEGSEKVVTYLLSKSACRGHRDSKGNTALYLATKKGFSNIISLLIKCHCIKTEAIDDEVLIEMDEIVCEVCKKTVKSHKRKEHASSIIHLYNQGPGRTKPLYGIPPTNKGYKLLLDQGWNSDMGLGPEGLGHKYPIKTILKRDRLGFGTESLSYKKKISHFSPGDNSAVQREPKQKFVKNYVSQKRKEKLKEISIRREFNQPDFPL